MVCLEGAASSSPGSPCCLLFHGRQVGGRFIRILPRTTRPFYCVPVCIGGKSMLS